MFCGTLGGVITGASIPIFNVLFGQILDKLNSSPSKAKSTTLALPLRLMLNFVLQTHLMLESIFYAFSSASWQEQTCSAVLLR